MIDLPLLAELALALLIVATLDSPKPPSGTAQTTAAGGAAGAGAEDSAPCWQADTDRHAQRILRIESLRCIA